MRSISVVYGNRYWNVTVTDVVDVERRGEPSVQSRFIIAFLGSRSWS
jgi:hypothetical protein